MTIRTKKTNIDINTRPERTIDINGHVIKYTPKERLIVLDLWYKKRKQLKFDKTSNCYPCRRHFANHRKRIGGRFVSTLESQKIKKSCKTFVQLPVNTANNSDTEYVFESVNTHVELGKKTNFNTSDYNIENDTSRRVVLRNNLLDYGFDASILSHDKLVDFYTSDACELETRKQEKLQYQKLISYPPYPFMIKESECQLKEATCHDFLSLN